MWHKKARVSVLEKPFLRPLIGLKRLAKDKICILFVRRISDEEKKISFSKLASVVDVTKRFLSLMVRQNRQIFSFWKVFSVQAPSHTHKY
jgi:hypothetical protein